MIHITTACRNESDRLRWNAHLTRHRHRSMPEWFGLRSRVCRPVVAIVGAIVSAASITNTASASTLTVCASGCGYTTIDAAIAASVSGDVIEVAAGTYLLSSPLDPAGKAITIRGALNAQGAPAAVLDGQGLTSIFMFDSNEAPNTVLEHLVITNGYGGNAGAIDIVDSSPTVRHCRIVNNSGIVGGGVMIKYGAPLFEHCEIADNVAGAYGGGCYISTEGARFVECVIARNTATTGGGILLSGSISMEACELLGNHGGSHGGGISMKAGNPTFTTCRVSGNDAHTGGGMYLGHSSAPVITNCEFVGNAAVGATSGGGGLRLDYGSAPRIMSSVVRANSSACCGGGLQIDAMSLPAPGVVIQDTIICGNSAPVNPQVQGSTVGFQDTCVADVCDDCGLSVADVNADGLVDGLDLAFVLSNWGLSGPTQGDVNGDQLVDGLDLAMLLSDWG